MARKVAPREDGSTKAFRKAVRAMGKPSSKEKKEGR